MFLGFILGLFAGVMLMCLVQINSLNKDLSDNYQEMMKEEPTCFTYDCLNDEDDNKDIPKIH